MDFSGLSEGVTILNGLVLPDSTYKLVDEGGREGVDKFLEAVQAANSTTSSDLFSGLNFNLNTPTSGPSLLFTGAEDITLTDGDDIIIYKPLEDVKQYFGDWPGEAGNLEIGEIRGGAGNDIIIAGLPALLSVGDKIGDAPGRRS